MGNSNVIQGTEQKFMLGNIPLYEDDLIFKVWPYTGKNTLNKPIILYKTPF